MRNEQLAQLAEALAKLSPSQRDAVEAIYIQGQSLADVAEQMDRSPSAVGGLIHRGLKQLRQLLQNTDGFSQLANVLKPNQNGTI